MLKRMARGSSFQVFFTGPTTIGDAAQALSRKMHVVEDENGFTVRWPDVTEPELVVGLSAEPHIAVEAAEIAGYRKIDAFKAFDRRFEVYIDDLDKALDEINTMNEVQLTLQDLTNGYIVRSWNGAIDPPHQAD